MSQQLRSAEILKEKARREEERLERLVVRCGPAFHLVPDNLLVADDINHYNPPAHQAYIAIDELRYSVHCLKHEPLLTAFQAGLAAAAAVQCQHCPPSQPLTVRYLNLSGSSAECLYDLYIGKGGTSDFDYMFEFGGPFRWAEGAGCISQRQRLSCMLSQAPARALSPFTGRVHPGAAMRPRWRRCRLTLSAG